MSNGKKGAHWVTEPDAEISINVVKSENGSEAGRAPLTVIDVFQTTRTKFGNCNAMGLKRALKVSCCLQFGDKLFPPILSSLPSVHLHT